MVESIDAWWERRQRSKGAAVPYAVGTYREAWSTFPMLIRQYHPEFNRGITLTQIPPAADVYLTWQCESGHVFVATPEEQRSRPGRVRRRSAWCPECSLGARGGPRVRPLPLDPRPVESRPLDAAPFERRPAPLPRDPGSAPHQTPAPRPASSGHHSSAPPQHDRAPKRPSPFARPAPDAPARAARIRPTPDAARPHVAPAAGAPEPRRRERGEPFRSPHAPRTASAAEADLRRRLAERLDLDLDAHNAVWVAQDFHGRREVWPDIVLGDLRVAIEYDTVGRFGLEHVGPREQSDRWKDRVLRQCGWEVIRIRTGALRPLGPHDVVAPGITATLIDRLLDELALVRGPLFVAAYLR
ncbi:zinc-ribbon domain-containing protein [Cnuibacter physcomitrellae]|uniref:zinc-ribbon domain-containing protein n=1 Tax=Cnuibacter physcomitrellae TaxID=1619308 RepID=UPI002175814F|nr:zinc-ribbon domain-containing protein [Cnuibacter physcomitrellae]MCS5497198.1 zinc-ribbon domain-containing protein [Cnuibacter physcomitrellae]